MKRTLSFLSGIAVIFIASGAWAQLAQTKLFVDNGSGTFATINATGLVAPTTFTLPTGGGTQTIVTSANQMLYNTAAPGNNGATITATNYLFDAQYDASTIAAFNALGAIITSTNTSTGANNNATGLTVAATATSTGTAIGLSASASGGSTGNNFAIIVPASSGNVGVGTSTPASLLTVTGAPLTTVPVLSVTNSGSGTTDIGALITVSGAATNDVGLTFAVSAPGAYDIQGSGTTPGNWNVTSAGVGAFSSALLNTATTVANASLSILGTGAGGPGTGVGGHIQSQQTTAPSATPSGAAISATGVTTATDVAGKVSFTATGSTSTDYVQVNFEASYTTAPIVVITPADATTASHFADFYVTPATAQFRINLDSPVVGPTAFNFYYHVIETR